MHASLTSTPLTVGKLLGLTFGMYRTHSGAFLRTAAIFYLPLAALSVFFVRDSITTTIFSFVIFPIESFASLSLIAHCVDLLHGRPLAVRTAVGRGLRRLPADIGMMLAMTAVFGGVALVAAIPIWVGLLNADIPFEEIRYAFADLVSRGDIAGINSLLGEFLWSGLGVCLTSVLILPVFLYLAARWLIAEVALMAERTGPLQSLGRSWYLNRDFVLRTAGYLILLSIVTGVVGALIGALVDFALLPLIPGVDQSWKTGFSYAVSKLSSIITTPFYITAVVLYYFDLRVRKERYEFEVEQG